MKMNSGKIVKKITTTILLLTMLCSALIIPKEVKAEEGFTGELFRNESAVYNKVLARIAEDFSFYYLLFREGLVQTSKGYINKKGNIPI